MKKLNICIAGAAALLCFNCGDSDSVKQLTGTSEEMNELAEGNSSSSTDTKQSSSSVNDKLSSSSVDDQNPNSSSGGETHTPPANGNSLDAYVEAFGLQNKVRFDKAVMAMSTGDFLLKQQPMDGSDPYTEFEKEGVAKFTQENIGEIEEYFPNAAKTYAETVNAVKNGTNECALYSYNSYGNEKYTGLVLEYVSSDTLKVTGIAAKNCEETTDNMFVRFLVSYCGDLNKEPVIIENTVESSIKKEQCPAVDKTEWVGESSSSAGVTSSSSEEPPKSSSSSKEIETCRHISDVDGMTANGNCNTDTDTSIVIDCATGEKMKCEANYWVRDVCAPGSDCDGDGIPDGIRRLDLEPCDTEGSTLEFYNRYFVCNDGAWNRIDKQACDENGSTKTVGDFAFQCMENKWEYLPPPITYINENATDVYAMSRGGMAVTPRAVKVKSASGSVTFRDDGVLVDDRCTFNGVNAELRGDTLYATLLYPGCTTTGGSMGVITFTLSIDFADVNYIKYEGVGKTNAQKVYEAEELLPCGNTSTCQECKEGMAC
ncbi:MAG: hypothetical protein IKT05_06120 [Fibrobacter sp.]|nr:hypothetical protein [Fibrobacter sp.]